MKTRGHQYKSPVQVKAVSNAVEDVAPAADPASDSSVSDDEDVGFEVSTAPAKEGEAQEKIITQDSGLDEDDDAQSKKSKKKVGIYQYDQKVEKSLETFLFGKSLPSQSTVSDSDSSSESYGDESDEEVVKAPAPKVLSRDDSDQDSSDEDSEDEENAALAKDASNRKRKAAWEDEDDEDVLVKDVVASYSKAKGKHGKKETSKESYAETLRKKFKTLVDTPKWADLSRNSAEDEDSDDEFFRQTTDMLENSKRETIAKGLLDYRKCKDMNEMTHNEGTVIRAAEFHPSAAVGLVAGLNGTASLFQIDGKQNPKMQSVNFENFPIRTAHFTSDGKQFIVGSQHFPHYFVYDLNAGKSIKVPWRSQGDGQGCVHNFQVSPALGSDLMAFIGRFGDIHILSQKSRTKLFTLKSNDNVNSVAFSPDGSQLYSHGAGGEVYIWDLKAQDCIHRFADDGCVRGTAIAVSKNNRYLSTGSDSGVVNIYNRNELYTSSNPKPEKVILNLTTNVNHVKFNPTSEILALASENKENAVKLVHLPSMTVFQNFPSLNYNLKRPNCLDFSLNGGYMSIGNNRGAANLYRLKHFGNY